METGFLSILFSLPLSLPFRPLYFSLFLFPSLSHSHFFHGNMLMRMKVLYSSFHSREMFSFNQSSSSSYFVPFFLFFSFFSSRFSLSFSFPLFSSLKLSFFTYFLHQILTFIAFEFFSLTPQIDLSPVLFLERYFSSIILRLPLLLLLSFSLKKMRNEVGRK